MILFIIPGLIESREEYFEFVKKLKDRGRNGLGRSIYERYGLNKKIKAKNISLNLFFY